LEDGDEEKRGAMRRGILTEKADSQHQIESEKLILCPVERIIAQETNSVVELFLSKPPVVPSGTPLSARCGGPTVLKGGGSSFKGAPVKGGALKLEYTSRRAFF